MGLVRRMALSRKAKLRAEAMVRAGGACEWPPYCELPGRLEMSHVMPSQMGGNPSRDRLDNVWMLCKFHHDMLDGREPQKAREYRLLVQAYLELKYEH